MRQQQFVVGSHTLTLLWSDHFPDPKQISTVRSLEGRFVVSFGDHAQLTITLKGRHSSITGELCSPGAIIVMTEHGKILFEERQLSATPPETKYPVHSRHNAVN